VAHEVGGEVVAPEDVCHTECDVFAPCAAAGVIGAEQIAGLQCRIVAGAANDTLTDDALAAELRQRGILYVPDFVANAGGVIHIHGVREGWSSARLHAEVAAIGPRVAELLTRAAVSDGTPLDAAKALAAERLQAGTTQPSGADPLSPSQSGSVHHSETGSLHEVAA
jgi:leucine dehydrogenase